MRDGGPPDMRRTTAEWRRTAIDPACLRPDLEQVPCRHVVPVGGRGITLSGGHAHKPGHTELHLVYNIETPTGMHAQEQLCKCISRGDVLMLV